MELTLKAARVNCGLTQRQMSERIGCSRDTYRSIEHNPGRASVDQAKAISAVVGVPYDNLFFAQ